MNNEERIKNLKEEQYQKIFGVKKKTFDKMLEILNNPNSRIHEIINAEFVQDMISNHGAQLKENLFGQLMTYPQTIAFIIQIDYWLTAYNIQIV